MNHAAETPNRPGRSAKPLRITDRSTFIWNTRFGRRKLPWLPAVGIALVWSVPAWAADQWIEVRSPHFAVVSNAGEGTTRTLAWQLEQIRSAMQALSSWARADLNKPLCVIALKDEQSMRVLAPGYWEVRGGVRPASVWVTAPDRHYLTIRSDLRATDTDVTNPHVNAYFSYVSLVMQQSLDPDLPLWFSRGLAGVLSNTIVRDDFVYVGAPIPWHLQRLRERARPALGTLLTVTRRSPEVAREEQLQTFDAQAWAFVHFLMFADQQKRVAPLNRFAQLVSGGTDAQSAFNEALGSIRALEDPFDAYVERSIYTFGKVKLDVSVDRERFPVRRLADAESAAVRAAFHAALGRPREARALIAEAQKADAALPDSHLAEALLLDREAKPSEAQAAFAKAIELGSTSAYANYRLASLMWRPNADRETLVEIEKRLQRAIELNNRYASAYSWLGEIRAVLGAGESYGLIERALSIEPREPIHRLRAAFVLTRQGKLDEAQSQARTAQTLADTDEERRRAQELLDMIAKRKGESRN